MTRLATLQERDAQAVVERHEENKVVLTDIRRCLFDGQTGLVVRVDRLERLGQLVAWVAGTLVVLVIKEIVTWFVTRGG